MYYGGCSHCLDGLFTTIFLHNSFFSLSFLNEHFIFWNLQSKHSFIKIPSPPHFSFFLVIPMMIPTGYHKKNLKSGQVFTLKLYLTPNDWSCHSCVERHFEISCNIIELEKQGYLLAHYFNAFLYGREGKGSMPKLFSRVLGFGGGKRNNKQQ